MGLYRLFEQIQFDPEQQPKIFCDNQQTVGSRIPIPSLVSTFVFRGRWSLCHSESRLHVVWVENRS
jgi:hypothetical protein